MTSLFKIPKHLEVTSETTPLGLMTTRLNNSFVSGIGNAPARPRRRRANDEDKNSSGGGWMSLSSENKTSKLAIEQEDDAVAPVAQNKVFLCWSSTLHSLLLLFKTTDIET